MLNFRSIIILAVSLTIVTTSYPQQKKQPASITVDFNQEIGNADPVWAWFGYDEPNYTYMKDGKKLLTELAELSPVPVYVRAHNLLTTGDGTPALKWGSTNAYTEDVNGNPVYYWPILDSIFDTYIDRGMKPLVQMGFMPEALSTKPQPYRHHWKPGDVYQEIHTGWVYPPKDYQKWADLIYQWVRHSIDRYGKDEVETWYWELWNEPDSKYWGGTVDEYCKLYDYSVDAVRRALPTAKVGGPHTTGAIGNAGKFLKTFLDHCVHGTNYVTGKKGTPIDFIAWHAKGAPKVVDGKVRMDMSRQLSQIANGFAMVASYPELKHLPLIIGESDPEGCAACGMATNPENAYRNGTMFSSYTAASFARKYALADSLKINFLGAVSWSFEFENQPWFFGFRDLATNGVDKPVLNVFRMFGKMTGKRVKVTGTQMYPLHKIVNTSVRESCDIGGHATKDKNTAAVMVWNYHDDDERLDDVAEVIIQVNGLSAQNVKLTEFRIDSQHSNSYTLWKQMGSPQNPTAAQIAELEKAGQLKTVGDPKHINLQSGSASVNIQLPRQGVSLLSFAW